MDFIGVGEGWTLPPFLGTNETTPPLQVLGPPAVSEAMAMPLGVIQGDELRLYLADLQGPVVEVGGVTTNGRW